MALALFAPSLRAASFLPVLHNFGKKDYGAALQNWDVSQGPNGEIFVGNGKGLLRYDGFTWTYTSLPSGGVIRSVMADAERVYVGTYRDFGYFSPTVDGTLVYTSLWPKNYASHDEEIWNIVKDRHGRIYFQSFSAWFSYDGTTVKPHYDAKKCPLYFFEVNGEIYTQILNGDFCKVVGETLKPLFKREEVGGSHVVSALPGGDGSIILCTQWKGVFRYRNGEITRFATDVDERMMKNNVNRATVIPHDGTLVIGTIIDGVYGIDKHGKLKWHYNMSNRLTNNSILDVKADRDGNVWVALDAGIALISTGSPFSLLAPDNLSPTLGMVYGLCAVPGSLFIATNQATWTLSKATGQYQMISGTEGQNWFVSDFGNQIIVGNNEGSLFVDGMQGKRIGDTHQSSTAMLVNQFGGKRVLLETSYFGVQVYVDRDGRWEFSHTIEGFHAPVAQFEVDHLGNIWASHMSHGLFKVNLSADLKTAKYKRFEYLDGDSVFDRFHVLKIKERVVFSYNKKLFTYDDIHDTIVRYKGLEALEKQDIYAATRVDDDTYWLSSATNFYMIKWNGKKFTTIHTITPSLFGLDANDQTNMVYVKDHIAYFGLNNGIGRYDMKSAVRMHSSKHKLQVLSATTADKQGSMRRLPLDGSGESETNVTITLSYPNYSFEPLQYCYSLRGGGNTIVNESHDPVITYNSLNYGSYQLTVTVKNNEGTALGTVEFSFTHPRPWYLSWWAWACYVAAIIAIVYFYARWRTEKTARDMQRQYEDKKLQQDLKMLEQEKLIAQQQKQLLEAQLTDKTKEVASMALDAMARNQAIESIRTSLREKRRKGTISQADMQSMLSQLGANADSDNFWELYQNNFNLIHENFFKNLKEKYPSLTSNDLKFCALLRLNLSTKDIAKFTQLSVRGVEGARYRLRKKFNLEEGQSLLDFLLSFQ
ncbi:MAG: hypothetical protein Q4B68_03505 [Bacteroidales bacterium]|nr:hypothetical protein [Bacteroidales bacterium]